MERGGIHSSQRVRRNHHQHDVGGSVWGTSSERAVQQGQGMRSEGPGMAGNAPAGGAGLMYDKLEK